MHKKNIRVAINATALLSPRTGIGQYVYSLANELMNSQEIQPYFFYAKSWSASLRKDPVARITPIKAGIRKIVPCAYAVSRLLSQIGFSAGLARRPCHVYHEPNYLAYRFRGPTVITVHDLSWIRHPETHPKDRLKAMDRYFPRSLERASAILTDCKFVKGELIDVFGIAPDRIHPVPLGVSPEFAPYPATMCAEYLSRHGLEFGRYFLSVGTLEPRKNIISLLDAFAKLPAVLQKRYPLVLVGMRGWLTGSMDAKIKPLLDSGLVRLLGYVPAEMMPALYSGAAAFIFPSLYEGFGLPPLEAMACGAPVIASNTSSLPEVVGEAGISVAPLDIDRIAESMRQLVEDQELARKLAQYGIERAKDFTWQRTAKQTSLVYKKVIQI